MTRTYVPASGLDDWRKRLADPDLHWKDGYSAKLTAEAWHAADGFPTAVVEAFRAAGEPLSGLEPLLILPEHQIALPPQGARPTQADVWVLASHAGGLASIAVEGKKDESFGPTLDEWLARETPGKHERLNFLTALLGLPNILPGTLRYQFLHRAGGAVVEAQRFRADVAVLLVQSFSAVNAGWPDYQAFVELFGAEPHPSEVVRLAALNGVTLYAAWIRDL